MSQINLVTILLLTIFLVPVISGAVRGFSRERVYSSVGSLFHYVLLMFGLFLSIYLSRKMFIDRQDGGLYTYFYKLFPNALRSYLEGKDVMVYLTIVPLLLSLILIVLRIAAIPLYRHIIYPLSEKTYTALNKLSNMPKRLIGAASNIPKGAVAVFICGLLLNFYTYYYPTPELGKWMNESKAYNLLYKSAIYPILNSSIAKEIPVLLNDSFGRPGGEGRYADGRNGLSIPEQLINRIKGNVRVIEYFNGVTIDEAIKSNKEIDAKAKEITINAKTDREKAYKVYQWISSNVKYDYDKARKLSKDPEGISSGSMIAFETRKGICFDFSSLFISMCRASGLRVQLITGLGYSGVSWGDHAWNRVYSSEDKRWINVDTTFGILANYFDRDNFGVDHMNAEIQGEWPSQTAQNK